MAASPRLFCEVKGKASTITPLVDVRVLDHFIVAGMEVLSFSERGLI